ncbi:MULTISPECIES: hypothetical protein [unclassified Microbacterium]|uniref:hypothetical protein n=1 Tax=unclassified Microbacterium TaxID=2609290 RepID=UPI003745AFE2
MTNAVDAIVEIFTWVGFGAGALLAGIAFILYVADGTWLPVRAMIDDHGDDRVARWFDADGGVGEAHLTAAQRDEIGDADAADVFVRQGSLDRMRLTRRSPNVRSVALLAGGLIGVGLVATIISVVTLFARG